MNAAVRRKTWATASSRSYIISGKMAGKPGNSKMELLRQLGHFKVDLFGAFTSSSRRQRV